MTTDAETTRRLKSALRESFPTCKFSVSRGHVKWSDTGPTVPEVEDVIVAASIVEVRPTWNNGRMLCLPDGSGSMGFYRFNVAEREAAQQDSERRRQEQEALQRNINAAIDRTSREKAARFEGVQNRKLSPIQDTTVFERFELLRQRAEMEVSIHRRDDTERRPSWAPAMILGDELESVCRELGYLSAEDKGIARFWATFASPKKSGAWLRDHTSNLPLAGLACRGFQLHAGSTRGTADGMLFEAQREETGMWRFGPHEYYPRYRSAYEREWRDLIERRERVRFIFRNPEQAEELARRVAEIDKQLEAIDAADTARTMVYTRRQQLRQRALELAQARVLDFIGAPDAQMQLAARLCGHCCCCFKALTDPISLERGIGPDCYAARIDFIRMHAASKSVEWISFCSGMPREFVTDVTNEQAVE